MTDRNFEFFDEWTIRQTDRAYLDARDVRDLDLGHGKIPPGDSWYGRITRRLGQVTHWLPEEVGERAGLLRMIVATAVLDHERRKVLVDADGRVLFDHHCRRGDTPPIQWAPHKMDGQWEYTAGNDNYTFFSSSRALDHILKDPDNPRPLSMSDIQVVAANEQTIHPVTSVLLECEYGDYGSINYTGESPALVLPCALFVDSTAVRGLRDGMSWLEPAEVDALTEPGQRLLKHTDEVMGLDFLFAF